MAAAVGFPGDPPLILVAASVGVKELAIAAVRRQLPQRRLPEVVHEHVLGADDAVAGPVHAASVVVVFEHADLEAVVERPDRLEHGPPQGEAEHLGDLDIHGLRARQLLPASAGEIEHLPVGPVAAGDLGGAPAAVGGRPDEADGRILEVRRQPGQPAGGHDRVVVEQHQNVASGRRETLVAGAGEAQVQVVANQAHMAVAGREHLEVVARRRSEPLSTTTIS